MTICSAVIGVVIRTFSVPRFISSQMALLKNRTATICETTNWNHATVIITVLPTSAMRETLYVELFQPREEFFDSHAVNTRIPKTERYKLRRT